MTACITGPCTCPLTASVISVATGGDNHTASCIHQFMSIRLAQLKSGIGVIWLGFRSLSRVELSGDWGGRNTYIHTQFFERHHLSFTVSSHASRATAVHDPPCAVGDAVPNLKRHTVIAMIHRKGSSVDVSTDNAA